MLCTVARTALPREHAEVSPLPPSVGTEPLHHEFFSFPSLYSGQTSCRLHLLHTLHQRGRWPRLCHPSLCAHIQTPRAGSWSWRCQTWRGAGLAACSAPLGSQERKAPWVWSPFTGILRAAAPQETGALRVPGK